MKRIWYYSDAIINNYPELFNKIQNSFYSTLVYYIINSKFRKSVHLKKWLKKQVNAQPILTIAAKIVNRNDYDLQVIEVLRWVKIALAYRGDTITWKMKEHWNTGIETLEKYEGDCEDGAILAYLLCRAKGVPANRLLIVAGSVRGGGHAWLAYKPRNYPLNFVFLDWSYWVSLKAVNKRNIFEIVGKTIREFNSVGIQQVSLYYKIWFMFNEDIAYSKIRYKGNL